MNPFRLMRTRTNRRYREHNSEGGDYEGSRQIHIFTIHLIFIYLLIRIANPSLFIYSAIKRQKIVAAHTVTGAGTGLPGSAVKWLPVQWLEEEADEGVWNINLVCLVVGRTG